MSKFLICSLFSLSLFTFHPTLEAETNKADHTVKVEQNFFKKIVNWSGNHMLKGVANLFAFAVFRDTTLKRSSASAENSELGSDEVIVKIEKGSSVRTIAKLLKEAGLIKSTFQFVFYCRFYGASTELQAGEYVFQRGIFTPAIVGRMLQGQVRHYRIIFPEGYNMYEIAEALEKEEWIEAEEFLELVQNPEFISELLGPELSQQVDSLEGYLFPDTYFIAKPLEVKTLIRRMVQNFFEAYNELSNKGQLLPRAKGVELGPHEAVILASVVEKETGLAQERPLIAGVFYNRLSKNMRLESDPTTLYGMMREAGGLVTLNIRRKDLLKKTPYNTYKISRLPRGPVANPGRAALESVFKPELSSYYYFVSRNDGSHVFSENYEEHEKAVNKFQKGQ